MIRVAIVTVSDSAAGGAREDLSGPAVAARAAAMETARMALAPRRDLVGVPSRVIILWSRARWSAASEPVTALAISALALWTALRTPLPRYLDLSASRSSRASCSR